MRQKLKQCKICLMDGSATEFEETETGCNFCDAAREELKKTRGQTFPLKPNLPKADPPPADKTKSYDCLIGLSGGVDSSQTLITALEMGFSPLTFSVDNGWNSVTAEENIMNLVEGLKVPFFRFVLDQKKFIDLQSAFLIAGLPNLEIPTDHILMAATYEIAERYGIDAIFSGGNAVSESIMPPSWGASARSLTHIKDVYRKIKGKELEESEGLPLCSLGKLNYYWWQKKIRTYYPLDYVPYNPNEAAEELSKRFGWKEYGMKHGESLYTAWFQNHYLFHKFGFDKRKAHLSSLIVAGIITRREALESMSRDPVYPDIGWNDSVLTAYKKRRHEDFATDDMVYNYFAQHYDN